MMAGETPLEIDVHAAADQLAGPAAPFLLDVREPGEIALCRLPGSVAIPLREIPARLGELPRDRPILVLCHHGGRSLRVTHFLRQQGLAAVTNIAGGIDAWARAIDPAVPRY